MGSGKLNALLPQYSRKGTSWAGVRPEEFPGLTGAPALQLLSQCKTLATEAEREKGLERKQGR
jgi:hypothetical protein